MKGKLLSVLLILIAFAIMALVAALFWGCSEQKYYPVVIGYLDSIAENPEQESTLSKVENEAFNEVNWGDTVVKWNFILPEEKYRIIKSEGKIFIISVNGRWLLFSKNEPYLKIINMNDKEKLRILELSLFDN